MEAEVLGFRDVLGDFVDKIDSAVVVSVSMLGLRIKKTQRFFIKFQFIDTLSSGC